MQYKHVLDRAHGKGLCVRRALAAVSCTCCAEDVVVYDFDAYKDKTCAFLRRKPKSCDCLFADESGIYYIEMKNLPAKFGAVTNKVRSKLVQQGWTPDDFLSPDKGEALQREMDSALEEAFRGFCLHFKYADSRALLVDLHCRVGASPRDRMQCIARAEAEHFILLTSATVETTLLSYLGGYNRLLAQLFQSHKRRDGADPVARPRATLMTCAQFANLVQAPQQENP